MKEQQLFRCTYMRGGTSKAVFIKKNELPVDIKERDEVIKAIFSTDERQIDGMGGADITTSKVAIVSPSNREDADVDYNFGQVQIGRDAIDWNTNCGNISSAVGPFAIDEGMVKTTDPLTEVRIYNVNTDKILVAKVETKDGRAAVHGDFVLDGVPGTGSRIELDYCRTAGAATGRLLPTGNPTDILMVDGVGEVEVSIVDIANPVCFVKAADVGLCGDEPKPELAGNRGMLEKLEKIRAAAAVRCGFTDDLSKVLDESPTRPMMAFVSPARDYVNYASGEVISGNEVDFLSRVLWNQEPVDTYTGTGTICTCVASCIEGTVVNQVKGNSEVVPGQVSFGHGRGINTVAVSVSKTDSGFVVEKAVFNRTARRIMDGYCYVKNEKIGLPGIER